MQVVLNEVFSPGWTCPQGEGRDEGFWKSDTLHDPSLVQALHSQLQVLPCIPHLPALAQWSYRRRRPSRVSAAYDLRIGLTGEYCGFFQLSSVQCFWRIPQ